IIGSVFAGRKLAILLHAGFGHVLRIFILNALVAFVVGRGIGGRPPVLQVAFGVELASLIIVAMNDFVSDYRPAPAIIDGIDLRALQEWRPQNAGGKIYCVGLRIFIGTYNR